MESELLYRWRALGDYIADLFEFTSEGMEPVFREMDLRMKLGLLEANYDHADLRQFARAALTVEPAPSSYEIKHGAIPT